MRRFVPCLVAAVGLSAQCVVAQTVNAADSAAFFESKVRPLLVDRCLSCHGDSLQSGGLRLDSRAAILKGGASGPAVVSGDLARSRLIAVIGYAGKIRMPPTGKLKPDQISTLTEWIKLGVPWPDAKPVAPVAKPGMVVSAAQRRMWPFAPFTKPTPPAVKDAAWCRSPIDRFILAKLEASCLHPAPPADRRTLIRRVTFDLIGLPPTPTEVRDFLADRRPDAYERVVDRLLADTRYGERWGRHWLDVARYADSNGLDENKAFAYAWRYRDYVVSAMNCDKPYDQFVREQLAGDLLPAANPGIRNEHLTATGFLSLGAKVLAEQDKPKLVMDIVDEQIDVTSKAFLGLTVACARCHDHKFDPIPTRDYYALAGIFKSTKTMKNLGFVSEWNEREIVTPELQKQLDIHAALEAAVKSTVDHANETVLAEVRRDAALYLLAGWELAQQPPLTPLTNHRPPENSGSRILIEAESYSRGNALKNFDTYGKGIGVIHTGVSPTFAEWDLNVAQPGLYQLDFRYASAEVRTVHLLLNGKLVREDAAPSATGSFNPDGQRWEAQGYYRFHAGNNVLRIESATAIPHIDRLMLAPALGMDGRPILTVEEVAARYGIKVGSLTHWVSRLRNASNDRVLGLWKSYARLPVDGFAQSAANIGSAAVSFGAIDPAVARAFARLHPTSLRDVAEQYARLFREADGSQDPVMSNVAQLLKSGVGLFTLAAMPDEDYDFADTVAVQSARAALAKAPAFVAPLVMAVEEGTPENCRIHIRGSTLNLGDEAPRRFLTVLGGDRVTPIDSTRSGRLEFAQWLTRLDHPLTSRVAVNRIWQEHFGAGIVRTPENFGLLGARPSHPELLDWLARSFVEQGWSMKRLHRIIVLSNTYRMSCGSSASAQRLDPDNRLLSHFNRRRLEAEPFRDAILAVAGDLDATMGGSLLTTNDNDYVTNDQSADAARYASLRRSLYLPIVRNALFDMFQAFDFGDPSMVNAHRATTTVAPQALFVLNSPFVRAQAGVWAQALLKAPEPSDSQRINLAYEQAFSRPATAHETARAEMYLRNYSTLFDASEPDPEKRRRNTWQSLAQALFAANEFIYVN